MKLSIGIFMMVASILGMAISFMGDVFITSPVVSFNGLEISLGLGIFFVLSFLSSVYLIASST